MVPSRIDTAAVNPHNPAPDSLSQAAGPTMAQGNRVLRELRVCPIRDTAAVVAMLCGVLLWSAVAAAQLPGDPSGGPPGERVGGADPLSAEEPPSGQIEFEPLPPSSGLVSEVPPIRPTPRREPLFARLGMLRPPGRYLGPGQPLLRESWQYRPFSIGWFMGAMQGGTLVDDWTGAKAGYFGGYRLGWDCDYYWGCEFRAGFASLPEWDSTRAKIAQVQADNLAGLAPDDPLRERYDRGRDVDVNALGREPALLPLGRLDVAALRAGGAGRGPGRVPGPAGRRLRQDPLRDADGPGSEVPLQRPRGTAAGVFGQHFLRRGRPSDEPQCLGQRRRGNSFWRPSEGLLALQPRPPLLVGEQPWDAVAISLRAG